jgi:hypothetical protein
MVGGSREGHVPEFLSIMPASHLKSSDSNKALLVIF